MQITPKASWPWVKTLLHSIFDQPDAELVQAQFDRVLEALYAKLPACAAHLEAAREEILAYTTFPQVLRRQNWSNYPNERLSREIRRRTTSSASSRIASIIRLIGAVLAGQHDKWAESRRCLGLGALAKARNLDHNVVQSEEVTNPDLKALVA